MPDPKELQKKLKNLNSSQFEEVLFQLQIDPTLIRGNDTQAQKAIQVIGLLKQQPDGLTQLENILKDASSSISSSTASGSNSSCSPEPSPKTSKGLLPSLGVGLGLPLLIVIVFAIWPKDSPPSHQSTPSTSNNNSSTAPQPSHQSTPSTSNNNSYPCSEGYKFEGSGPGASGEDYSGRCNSISPDARPKSYPCIVQSGPCPKP